MNFGKIIRAKRNELRLTQDDVCERAEISKFKLVQIEKGKNVQMTEICKIGKALFLTTVFDWQAMDRKFAKKVK